MKAKKCFRCGIEKLLSEFYAHPGTLDGHLGKCKACTKIDVKANRETSNRIREYDNARAKLPHRKKLVIAGQIRRRKEHPEKEKAYEKVRLAIKSGILKRLPCEICGNTKPQAHHEDYSKPLGVKWLCQKHHDIRHSELGWG